MYFVVVYRARARVNPDPVYVAADVLLEDERMSTIDPPYEVRALAITLGTMYRDVELLRTKAESIHEQAKHRVKERKSIREAADTDELGEVMRRRSSSISRSAARKSMELKTRLYNLKDKVQVPTTWEEYLPGCELCAAARALAHVTEAAASRTRVRIAQMPPL